MTTCFLFRESALYVMMPPKDPPTSNSHDQIIYLSEQFKLHVEKKHPERLSLG